MATTIATPLQDFINTYGKLQVRTYDSLGFVAILCKAEDGTETFVAAPNPEGEHKMAEYPYDGDKKAVKAFLIKHKDDLRVIDGTSAAGNSVHTLCFSQFEDDTEDVF